MISFNIPADWKPTQRKNQSQQLVSDTLEYLKGCWLLK